MARSGDSATALRAMWSALRTRLSRRHDDGGFILLESIMALTVITIIMSAIGAEFVAAVASTTHQRDAQIAAQIGDSEAERIRSLHPSDLVLGRDATSVANEFLNAPTAVRPWLTTMNQISDSGASYPSGATATLPTSASSAAPQTLQKPSSITYTVLDYLGRCYIATNGTTCGKANTSGSIPYLRDVITVTWSGTRCTPLCSYVTSSLISATTDQTFKINQQLPAAPTLTNLTKTVAVNDAVSLQLTVDNGTGVAPFTWQMHTGSTLPTNLAISPTGLISGTVGGSSGTVTSKVDVTDAFLRSATMTITWTVEPPLVVSTVADQANVTGSAISPKLTLSASGGDGAPYTWSLVSGSTLPPGLSLSTAGVVSGTPSAVGTFQAQVQVVDKGGVRTATSNQFNWNITYPPVSPPVVSSKTSTVNTAVAAPPLVAGGGDGNFIWSDPTATLPPGVTMSSNGSFSGTPTTTGTYAIVLQLDDPTAGSGSQYNGISVKFTWNVVAMPSVTAPANQSNTTGKTINLPLTTTCPNSPCTYALSNTTLGLTMSGSGAITGTISAPAGTYSGLTVSVSDAQGVLVRSSTFTWTILGKPTVTAPANQTSSVGSPINLTLATSCPNAPCTYALNASAPSGISVTSGGVITGTITGTAKTYTGITITATDAQGVVGSASASFIWTVNSAPALANPGDQQTAQNKTITALSMSSRASGGTTPYASYAVISGSLPSGLTLNSSTGQITGTTASANSASTITVRVTDSAGATATTTFHWYVTNLALNVPNQTKQKGTAISLDVSTSTYTTGGSVPYTYSYTGSLPTGLSLSSAGKITGTPTATGTFTSTVTVIDNTGASVSDGITWTIYAPLAIANIPAQSTKKRNTGTLAVASYVSGGQGSYTYTLNSPPSWMTISSSTGVITVNAPSSTTTATVSVTVTDGVGNSMTSNNFVWSVTN